MGRTISWAEKKAILLRALSDGPLNQTCLRLKMETGFSYEVFKGLLESLLESKYITKERRRYVMKAGRGNALLHHITARGIDHLAELEEEIKNVEALKELEKMKALEDKKKKKKKTKYELIVEYISKAETFVHANLQEYSGARPSTTWNYLRVLLRRLLIRHRMPRVFGKPVYEKTPWWTQDKAIKAIKALMKTRAVQYKAKKKRLASEERKVCPRCVLSTLRKAGKISIDSPKDTQVWYCGRCGFRRLRRIE